MASSSNGPSTNGGAAAKVTDAGPATAAPPLSAGAAAGAMAPNRRGRPPTTTTTNNIVAPPTPVAGPNGGGGGKARKKEQGDPGYANALLSLGQDLTSGQPSASPAADPEGGQVGASPPAPGPQTTQAAKVAQLPDPPAGAEQEHPQAAGTDVGVAAATNNATKPKRKHSEILTSSAGATAGAGGAGEDLPPDFWFWLPEGQEIGDWDVLCGRGGESNNLVGNKRYRKVVNERKEDYRKIDLKLRKMKTSFVRDIVHHINTCGGRFIDVDDKSGKHYVVTMEKARKKTSQALRETKELKWLDIDEIKAGGNGAKKKTANKKDLICPFCQLPGHKTRIASACLKHHEWLDASKADAKADQGVAASSATTQTSGPSADAAPQQLPFLLPKDAPGLAPNVPGDAAAVPEPFSATDAAPAVQFGGNQSHQMEGPKGDGVSNMSGAVRV